tara:strand:+ start:96 stop:269 length:174 start_codon:yes stop_codon:yes gene_type:complete
MKFEIEIVEKVKGVKDFYNCRAILCGKKSPTFHSTKDEIKKLVEYYKGAEKTTFYRI